MVRPCVVVGVLASSVLVLGCSDSRRADEERDPSLSEGIAGGSTGGYGEDTGAGVDDGSIKLDVPSEPTPDCEGEACGDDQTCSLLEHTPCDGSGDLFRAMGLNCEGEPTLNVTSLGNPAAMGVRSSFGPSDEWNPREGTEYAVIGSGLLADLDSAPDPILELDEHPTHCNDDLGSEYDPETLPEPIRTNDVEGDCAADPSLLGTGDCSSSIQQQVIQDGMPRAINDYTEVRIEGVVPDGANSISFDFAFLSTEYPHYYGDVFNDMFVAWVESESWTGNVSFDEQGNPISLNAGFLDFKDDGGSVHPELTGTCMQRHGGTRWLTTTAPVTSGESITVVLGIFDLADSLLDSYVFLDNWQWGCDGSDTPSTTPVG